MSGVNLLAPSDNPLLLAFAVLVATSLLWRAVRAYPHDHRYTSTACEHDRHERCRLVCKFCPSRCVCPCHRLTADATKPGKSPA